MHFAPVTELIDILLCELDVGSPGLYRPGSPEGENDMLVGFIYGEESSYITKGFSSVLIRMLAGLGYGCLG